MIPFRRMHLFVNDAHGAHPVWKPRPPRPWAPFTIVIKGMTSAARRVPSFAVAPLPKLLLSVLLLGVAVPLVTAAPGVRWAQADEEVTVGSALQAITDVTLHQADIAKGSRVSVTEVARRNGHIDVVSVALTDGHVVRVPVAVMLAAFRVVHE